MLVTYEGVVEEIIFTNEVNGFTVCEIQNDEETIIAVGFMPFINVGETLKVTGKMVNHPDYGEQLKVEMYEKTLPKTIEAIEKYLGSGLIKGVGPATARKNCKKIRGGYFKYNPIPSGRVGNYKGYKAGKGFENRRDICRAEGT